MNDKAVKLAAPRGIQNSLSLLFIITAFLIIAGTYFLYSAERKQIQRNYENNLNAIAKIKKQQITDWRNERIANVKAISEGPIIQGNYEKWIKQGKKDERIKSSLTKLLINWKRNYDYDAIIFNNNGHVDLSLDPNLNITAKFSEAIMNNINKVLKTGEIIFGDYHESSRHGKIMIDIMAPLQSKEGNKILGILAILIDPQESLLPMLARWPVASETSEALLVRSEGDEVLFLHDLRNKKGTALKFRLPINTPDLPAAMAARGQEGAVTGIDYRGVAVIAVVFKIPDSPWYLVVKTDKSEVMAAARGNLIRYIIICIALIALAAALIQVFSVRQQKTLYKKLYLAEKERQQAQNALVENEFKYRSFFEYSQESMTIYRGDTIINCNRAATEMFRLPREKFIGYHFWDFLTEYQPDGSSSLEKGKNQVRQSLKGKHDIVAYRFRRVDGTEFDGEVIVNSIVFEGELYYQSIVRDITERQQSEEALRRSEAKYRSLLNNAGDAILLGDKDGKIMETNKKAEELFGYSKEELLKLEIADLHPPQQLPLITATFRKIIATGQSSINDITIRRKNGELIAVDITGSRIASDGGIIMQGVFRDISERKKMEEERKRMEERLTRSEKMEALGMLAGGVAHDLNNVLGIIVGYSELLLHEISEQSSIRKRIENILKSGERATAIVQDLLTLARRGVQISKVINLNSIVSDYLQTPEFARLSSLHPSLEVKTEMEAGLLNIIGSPIHLTKTLMNLVSNAAEAMPQGGTLTIRTENRYLDKPIRGYDDVKDGDYVVLTVTDTGEGIATADLKRIFEPFYTKKVMGRSGTGLGLSVVWGTVKDSQGYIDVQSEQHQGTSFILYFPVTRQEIAEQQQEQSLADYLGRGESILVVDDIKEQRELAMQILSGLNYRVQTAASGEEAVSHLKNNKADIVILDMIMDPGMDGLTTYEMILKINPRQKAIIVSGFAETDRVLKAKELGAGKYVKKPYIQSQLGLAVRKELDRK